VSIIVDESTKLAVSGLTGREGSFHGLRNKAYGTDLVAGVTPGKGGQDVEGTPVFDSIAEAVAEAGGEGAAGEEAPEPVRLDVPVDAYLPATFVPFEAAKIDIHRRIVAAREPGQLRQIADELDDRFGQLPPQAENLLKLQQARIELGLAGARSVEFARLEPRDPACDHEIGLEGVDRGPQRLQHIGLDHGRCVKQPGCDAGQQLTLGQAVLHQAGVNVDGARQRDAIDRQLLIVDAIGRKTGEQNPDQRDKTDDET